MDTISETHWTRILSYDLMSGVASPHETESGGRAPAGARIDLTAADGYRLVATRYAPTVARKGTLVVAGEIGVRQWFYRRFALYAAQAGYETMTFDYRGIGLSAPRSLEGFRMSYFDWARYDLTAAVSASYRREMPLYVIGHSFGGHAFGLMPNHGLVNAFYTFGTGAGWHGWMRPWERFKALAMWHVLAPLLSRKGYLASSAVRMGEDLPIDVYRGWKRWCANPRYFFDDPEVAHIVRRFARVRAPLMAVNSIDDAWAPPQSRDAFITGYSNARREVLDVDPARLGISALGHMGYFKPAAVRLWKSALAWLDRHRTRE